MKRTFYLFTILLTSLILASCNKNSTNNSEPTEPALDPANSCILTVNAEWNSSRNRKIENRKCLIEITYSNGKLFKTITDLTTTKTIEYTIPKGSKVYVNISGIYEYYNDNATEPSITRSLYAEKTYMIGNLDKRTLSFFVSHEISINMEDK